MNPLIRTLILLSIALPALMAGPLDLAGYAQAVTEIGGQKVVTLTRNGFSKSKPEFASVTLAPGRGMEILQITANFPGKGEVEMLASPGLDGAKKMLDVDDDAFGNLGYRLGAAFLVPYPNRIRGKLSADGKTVTTQWQGHTLTLPANNIGTMPGAERHAMHGLILKTKTDQITVKKAGGGEEATGIIHAGDFGGHWLSQTDLEITVRLAADVMEATVVAKNVGRVDEPMAIAWHPYFNLPSGDRSQVRVRIPASNVAEVDNYDNVFPTGQVSSVDGTKYDFRGVGGTLLGNDYFDDNWSHIDWNNGLATVQIVDPAAHYGVNIEGSSLEIRTIQMYAPPDKSYVAIEHQYNFADPFGKEWGRMDTHMVTLKPGQSTKWQVRLRVFVPQGPI